ncbi:MAG: formylglycine-generating enzyme family protein [Gammaproteobacteria bacterium]|nr:formylglycine-generating enzyme family protein [Gammaproteobacteria bacterium]
MWLIPCLWVAWPLGWPLAALGAEADDELVPGSRFRDCNVCPEMVVVPAGEFLMGSSSGEVGRQGNEGPQHRVRIPQPFAVGVFEVTFTEWDACQRDAGCVGFGGDEGWGRGEHPAINVSWNDAQAYARWLSEKTGTVYRLLSESEWEYAARAGTTTPYHFGQSMSEQLANCCQDYGMTLPGGAFPANGFGLHDIHGNVQEWVQDCWNDNYREAPTDASVVAHK